MSKEYPIKLLCRVMDINRSGYYKWLNRDINQYERNRRDLAALIKKEHIRHPSYGYHALAKVIRDQTGWIFSDNLCHKVCKQERVRSKCRHYKFRKPGNEHVIYDNRICNNWNTTDGGGRGNRHLPGPGVPVGKKRAAAYAQVRELLIAPGAGRPLHAPHRKSKIRNG